ncbi:MAG: hypothetical protein ABSA15_05035 [Thermoplasmata archaeon]
MVHVKDEGSHFEQSLETIWKYMGDEDHGRAHKGTRNVEMKQVDPRTMELTQESEMGGHWIKTRDRITIYPPLGFSLEMLEGPMAGSKFFNYYTAKGGKTEVTVVGEFVSTQLPQAQIESTVHQILEHMFEEDKVALKEFSGKK